MRHKKSFNHLSRKSAHRKAMLANMASSLIVHKRIHTTVAKAKALRQYVEPLITKSKDDTTHSRRVVFRYLQDKNAVSELFREVSSKIAERPGGYTRILKTGTRLGDNADMCIIELVDYNENLLGITKAKTKSRRRRGSKKKAEADVAIAEQTTNVVDETVEVKEEAKAEAEAEVKEEEVRDETEAKAEEKVEEVKEEGKDEFKAEVKEEEVNKEPETEAKADKPEKEEEPKEDKKEEDKKDEN